MPVKYEDRMTISRLTKMLRSLPSDMQDYVVQVNGLNNQTLGTFTIDINNKVVILMEEAPHYAT